MQTFAYVLVFSVASLLLFTQTSELTKIIVPFENEKGEKPFKYKEITNEMTISERSLKNSVNNIKAIFNAGEYVISTGKRIIKSFTDMIFENDNNNDNNDNNNDNKK